MSPERETLKVDRIEIERTGRKPGSPGRLGKVSIVCVDGTRVEPLVTDIKWHGSVTDVETVTLTIYGGLTITDAKVVDA